MRSYNRSGMVCPVGVHYVGALGDREPLGRMFQILGVSPGEFFSPLGCNGIIDRYIFDDFVFDLPANLDAFEENLNQTFPEDKLAIGAVMMNLREISRRLMDFSFFINPNDPFQNMDYYLPMGDFLEKIKASAGLRAVLAVTCNLIGVPLNDCPVILHHIILVTYLFSSWKLKEGGNQLTEALVRRFQDAGGTLLLNDGVKKIQVEQTRVKGVMLESGQQIPADTVILAIHPKMLLNLLDENVLRESYRRRLRGLVETESVLGVQVKVDAAAHSEISHNIYRLQTHEKGTIKNGIFYQLRSSHNPAFNLLSMITQSLYDDWKPWENTYTGKRGSDYEEKKTELAQRLLKSAEDVFGPLQNARIIDVYTPLTIRDYVNAPRGTCFGIMRSSRQLLRAISLNNVPVSGLYLAGQNAAAPGVLGCMLGSLNVARHIVGADFLTRLRKI